MKKKIIIVLCVISIIFITILLSKNLLIKQYILKKIKNINYEEYIMTVYRNDKKNSIIFYDKNYLKVRNYDENENLLDTINVYDYVNKKKYEYILPQRISIDKEWQMEKNTNVNNEILIDFLENKEKVYKFKLLGKEKVYDKICFVLEFCTKDNYITKIWLDKELWYIRKQDTYIPVADKADSNYMDKHLILCYDIDFELNEKNLFE